MNTKFRLLFTAFLCSISSVLIAQSVSINEARTIAGQHLANVRQKSLKSASNLERNFRPTSVKVSVENKDTLYYILNDTINKSFVIVSADKRVWPILAYSTEGSLNETKQPEAFIAWMDDRKKEIESIKQNNLQPESATTASWQDLSLKSAAISSTSVEPLIQTHWDQGCYYNAMCPADVAGPCGHVSTGCTITAMAQIMKYWNYPTRGTGSHTYNHPTYGNLSADFGSTTYQWNQMPNSVTSKNDAVATLMYHCGVSLETDYGPKASGAWDPRDELVQYFNYSSNAMLVNRSGFATTEWINLLKSELDLRHPIWYTGSGGSVAHSFICDGYQDADYFHFNWGWSGSSDGYFYIGNLNPDWYSFNENQSAVINIVPGNLPDGYNGLFLSSNAVNVATKGGTTSVDVCSSANWSASSDQSWLSLSTMTGRAGKTTLILTCTENQTEKDRSATVTISAAGFGNQSITVSQYPKVNVTPGSLYNLISKNAVAISTLTLTGSIDARDFKTMRDAMPALTDIDLSNVTIAEYDGNEGTADHFQTYPVNEIPEGAFCIVTCRGENHLKSINLPKSITSIGNYSFQYCKYLTEISIPSSVNNIIYNAFGSCCALINVDSANQYYSSIDGVLFDKYRTNIIHCPTSKTGDYTIPSSVTSIKAFAFESCEKLSSITIPISVTSIEDLAFPNCSASIIVDNNNLNYSALDGVLFNKEQTVLIHCPISKTGSYVIPSSVIAIGSNAFESCSRLTNVAIPASVITIKDSAFSFCFGLKTATIPCSVISLGIQAFYSCKGMLDLTIPLSVARIEINAFDECVNLKSIHCNAITPINFTSSVTVFRNVNKSTCTLYIPHGSKDAYLSANQWKDFTNIVEMPGIFLSNDKISMVPEVSTAGVVVSSSSAWTASSDQTWLTVKPSTGSSGTDTITFTANENPTTAARSATITIIATGLTPQTIKVTQNSRVEVIAGNLKTLLGNQLSTITSLTLSGTIDARDFKTMRDEMPLLTNIDLSRVKITSYSGNEGTVDMSNKMYPADGVPNSAFYNQNTAQGKSGLKSVILPVTVTTIGLFAFNICTDLTTIDIPSSVIGIEGSAFNHCTGLTSINIPASVNSIANNAFGYFNGKIAVDEKNLTYSSIDGVLFNKDRTVLIQCPISKTGEYYIPPSVCLIQEHAFEFCRELTKVAISSSVKTIRWYAFSFCDNLKSIFAYSLIPVNLNSSLDVFFGLNKNTCTLYVPYGSKAQYTAADQWKDFTNIVEMPGIKLSATTVNLKSAQGSTAKIDISANISYSVASDQTWLTVGTATPTEASTLTLTATENAGSAARMAVVTVSASGVESQTITVIQESKNTTGVDQLSNKQEFIVYPNPTTEKIKLVFDEIPLSGITVTINDIAGKNCLTQLIRETESWIDLSGNVPGIYFIKTDQKNFKTQKVILK